MITTGTSQYLTTATSPTPATPTTPPTTTPEKPKEGLDDRHVALLVSVYTIIVFVVTLYFLVNIWPATPQELASNATTFNATRPVTLFGTGIHFLLGPETLIIFIIMFSGIICACVFSFFVISKHIGVDFNKEYLAWYLLRPLIGAGLPLIFYFLLRGGVLTVGTNLANLNLIGVAAISGLVGMFSENAMYKLKDLADTLFGNPPSKPNVTATATTTPAEGTATATTTPAEGTPTTDNA
jgi:hypothetical protein